MLSLRGSPFTPRHTHTAKGGTRPGLHHPSHDHCSAPTSLATKSSVALRQGQRVTFAVG